MPYQLCERFEPGLVLEVVAGRDAAAQCITGGGQVLVPTQGGQAGTVLCTRVVEVCAAWVEADAYLVANLMPSAADASTLYAWGFAVVVGPALVLWLAGLIVAGVRRISRSGIGGSS